MVSECFITTWDDQNTELCICPLTELENFLLTNYWALVNHLLWHAFVYGAIVNEPLHKAYFDPIVVLMEACAILTHEYSVIHRYIYRFKTTLWTVLQFGSTIDTILIFTSFIVEQLHEHFLLKTELGIMVADCITVWWYLINWLRIDSASFYQFEIGIVDSICSHWLMPWRTENIAFVQQRPVIRVMNHRNSRILLILRKSLVRLSIFNHLLGRLIWLFKFDGALLTWWTFIILGGCSLVLNLF